MFADEQSQALTIGLWIVGAFVVLQVINTILSTIIGWRKLTVVPPLADQFVTHTEIQALETRLTHKLNEQDKRLTDSEERTRQRIHDLSETIHVVKLKQEALPSIIRKDVEELLKPVAAIAIATDKAVASLTVKIDLIIPAVLPQKRPESQKS
jgi:hypothetical protein